MTPETFEPILRIEPISRDVLRTIARSMGPVVCAMLKLGDVDLKAGAGVIDGKSRCVWTGDGRRITFISEFGGFIGSISNTPDPGKPARPALAGGRPA